MAKHVIELKPQPKNKNWMLSQNKLHGHDEKGQAYKLKRKKSLTLPCINSSSWAGDVMVRAVCCWHTIIKIQQSLSVVADHVYYDHIVSHYLSLLLNVYLL